MLSQQKMNNLIKQKATETKAPLKNVSKLFGLEQLLKKISASDYRDKFILKGGYLLTATYGLEHRSTKDLDATIQNLAWTRGQAEKFVETLEGPDELGHRYFERISIRPTRQDMDGFSGFNIRINFINGKSRYPLDLDLTSGEILLPPNKDTLVPLMFEEGAIVLNTYSFEQILTDKIQATLSFGKGEKAEGYDDTNSRAKDLYDIYFLTKLNPKIDYPIILAALQKTLKQRNREIKPEEYMKILDFLEQSDLQQYHWLRYQEEHDFAKAISFSKVMASVKAFTSKLLEAQSHKKKFYERLEKAEEAQNEAVKNSKVQNGESEKTQKGVKNGL
ncbi:nucleotidyl transferase AbiEii/AbiGii toxin family protein [Lactococcus nasutitermitis]|uniref:Nucleotidyl transferase AbiEii/AbiGii toxin family protein n=2 Tax=Lactococcus nasutitermitis TaxID=1652957 RepID=A0ABV9JE73_9LACT